MSCHPGTWHQIVVVERGLSVEFQSNDPNLLREFFSCPFPAADLPLGCGENYCYSVQAQTRAHHRSYAVYEGLRRIAVVGSSAEAVMCLLSHLHWNIAQTSPDCIFVHAGVVGWKGVAVVMPGQSYAGKTSLVIELLRRGATYFSDEYAVFDAAGMVHPFRRDLHVRSEGGTRYRLPAASLADVDGTDPLPVGLLLFTSYCSGAEWQTRRLTPGHALLGLIRNAVSARRTPAEALHCLSRAAVSSPAYLAERGEASSAAQRILSLAENRYSRLLTPDLLHRRIKPCPH